MGSIQQFHSLLKGFSTKSAPKANSKTPIAYKRAQIEQKQHRVFLFVTEFGNPRKLGPICRARLDQRIGSPSQCTRDRNNTMCTRLDQPGKFSPNIIHSVGLSVKKSCSLLPLRRSVLFTTTSPSLFVFSFVGKKEGKVVFLLMRKPAASHLEGGEGVLQLAG